ncbi:MAG: UbiH/UbiF/VisC/COQ6 family ubiquinone biosynthesis hydroxylase [Marinobacter sp.]|nr:UbiH/UbiF/VisC/COQ6 family ubiquinone biosynthesis hydroxylase [Marinobacter sp.]
MATDTPFDIAVVGGGMTGSALALGLAQQGWRVALLEAQSLAELVAAPAPARSVMDFEPRVSALSLASARLLDALGVWEPLMSWRHCDYTAMQVWDGDGTADIRFDAAELHSPSLGTIVENRLLVMALFQALAASPVTVFDQAQVVGVQRQADGLSVIRLATGDTVQARLVVGADGPMSRLRQWAGLATREWDYEQLAIVCTVETSAPHEHTAWQRFSPTGPLAFLPLLDEAGGSQRCSIVWSQDTLEAKRLLALPDDDFRQALAAAFEYRLGEVVAVSPRHGFPLRQRHAKDYVAEGLVLVGDAAHTIHPLAGQGANLGYGDVRVLLDELQQAKQAGLTPSEPLLLQRYQRRRKAENLAMMAAMEGFKRLFAQDDPAIRWARNAGMRWLNQLPMLKNRIAAEAMGIR